MKKLTSRAKLYLAACSDWKADWEIVNLLGDTPPLSPRSVRPYLGVLIGKGLLQWSGAQNTYRVTHAGRLHLVSDKPTYGLREKD